MAIIFTKPSEKDDHPSSRDEDTEQEYYFVSLLYLAPVLTYFLSSLMLYLGVVRGPDDGGRNVVVNTIISPP